MPRAIKKPKFLTFLQRLRALKSAATISVDVLSLLPTFPIKKMSLKDEEAREAIEP